MVRYEFEDQELGLPRRAALKQEDVESQQA